MTAVPHGVTRWIAFTLRWGSYVSALLLLVGVVWVAVEPDLVTQAVRPMPLRGLGRQLVERNPYAVIQLGILLLLATPLLRAAVAGASFWVNRERRYTLVALVVLAIIGLTVFLGPGR